MIGRIWHGWTTTQNAEAYQRYLEGEILPDIRSGTGGLKGAYVLRREEGDEVEFMTLMLWDSMEAIETLVGEDHEAAYLPDEERQLLDRFEERVVHYEVVLAGVSTDSGPSEDDAGA